MTERFSPPTFTSPYVPSTISVFSTKAGLMMAHQTESGPRIPVALQDVFVASNRGEDVAVAPPNKMAAKIFGRFGLTRRSSSSSARGRPISTRSSAVVLLGWTSSSLRAKQVGTTTSSVVSPERSACDPQPSNGEKPTPANTVPAELDPGETVSARTGRQQNRETI
jgi:hypothetical protein